jgi:hypothetical protein
MRGLDLSGLDGLLALRLAGNSGSLRTDTSDAADNSDDEEDNILDRNGLLLPTQLQQLDLQGEWTLLEPGEGPQPKCVDISAMKQLQRVTLLIGSDAMDVSDSALRALAAMPALQHLTLLYKHAIRAGKHAMAGVWRALPGLAHISIDKEEGSSTPAFDEILEVSRPTIESADATYASTVLVILVPGLKWCTAARAADETQPLVQASKPCCITGHSAI